MRKLKLRFVIWDWKEAPEAGDLEKALKQVYNGKNLPKLIYVPDPDWDQYTLIVSSEKISEDQAQKIWKELPRNTKSVYHDVFEYEF